MWQFAEKSRIKHMGNFEVFLIIHIEWEFRFRPEDGKASDVATHRRTETDGERMMRNNLPVRSIYCQKRAVSERLGRLPTVR